MSGGYVAGDDEKSFVEIGAQRLRAHRWATGRFDGFDVYTGVYPIVEDNRRVWEVYTCVESDVGKEELTRSYQSRGDAYLAFEYLVDEHDLDEVETEDESGDHGNPRSYESVSFGDLVDDDMSI